MFDIVSVIYVSVISRKLWKKTVESSPSVRGVFIQLGDRPHIMYIANLTISAVSLHGEDTTSILPAAWTSIENPLGIGISPDCGRGVVRHTYALGDQVTNLILERGVWRQNTTYRVETTRSRGLFIQPVTITNSGDVITREVSIIICYE